MESSLKSLIKIESELRTTWIENQTVNGERELTESLEEERTKVSKGERLEIRIMRKEGRKRIYEEGFDGEKISHEYWK